MKDDKKKTGQFKGLTTLKEPFLSLMNEVPQITALTFCLTIQMCLFEGLLP